jgi:hypothetical protein
LVGIISPILLKRECECDWEVIAPIGPIAITQQRRAAGGRDDLETVIWIHVEISDHERFLGLSTCLGSSDLRDVLNALSGLIFSAVIEFACKVYRDDQQINRGGSLTEPDSTNRHMTAVILGRYCGQTMKDLQPRGGERVGDEPPNSALRDFLENVLRGISRFREYEKVDAMCLDEIGDEPRGTDPLIQVPK